MGIFGFGKKPDTQSIAQSTVATTAGSPTPAQPAPASEPPAPASSAAPASLTVTSEDQAGAALNRAGAIQQAVDAGSIEWVDGAKQVVFVVEGVVLWAIREGNNPYTALIDPVGQWAIYTFVRGAASDLMPGGNAVRGDAARAAFKVVSEFQKRYAHLKPEVY